MKPTKKTNKKTKLMMDSRFKKLDCRRRNDKNNFSRSIHISKRQIISNKEKVVVEEELEISKLHLFILRIEVNSMILRRKRQQQSWRVSIMKCN